MKLSYEWGGDLQSYIRVCVGEGFTSADLVTLMQQLHDELKGADAPVDVVCECDTALTLPPDIISILPELADRISRAENLGKIYIVGAHGSVRTVTEIFSTVFYPLYHVQAGLREWRHAAS